MHLKLMMASATVVLMTAGGAQAGPASSTALPSQPVPYTMLDAYLKATPKARAAMMGNTSAQAAQTDAAAKVETPGTASTSAMTPDAAASTAAAAEPAAPMNEPTGASGSMPSGPVNPPSATPPPTNSGSEMGATGSAAPDKP